MQLNADVEFSFLATRRVAAWRPTAAKCLSGWCPRNEAELLQRVTMTLGASTFISVCTVALPSIFFTFEMASL